MTTEDPGPADRRIRVQSGGTVDPDEQLRTRLTVAVCLLSSARVRLARTDQLSPETRARILTHLDEVADMLVDLPRDARGGNGGARAEAGWS